jgi:uncharacterized protein YqjF (DUF2071 family)
MAKPFLTARWSNIAMISYSVPRGLLTEHLPKGLEIDVLPGMGAETGLISLVAFDFSEMRVKGCRVPGCADFPEINLRFYAKAIDKDGRDVRGVVFLKELVPRKLVVWGAKRWYNEPYERRRIESRVEEGPDKITVEHRLEWLTGPSGEWKMSRKGTAMSAAATQSVKVVGEKQLTAAPVGSAEHWFKEHEWGFGVSHAGKTQRYRVKHPEWPVHRVTGFEMEFKFAQVFGPKWGFLRKVEPVNVLLAAGSEVAVYPKKRLRTR